MKQTIISYEEHLISGCFFGGVHTASGAEDAAGYFQPGQRILVKILEVDRSDRNQIKVTASVKKAGENPYEQALKKYTEGNRYVGTISMVDTNGVSVFYRITPIRMNLFYHRERNFGIKFGGKFILINIQEYAIVLTA